MATPDLRIAAGIDAGTECVKAVVIGESGQVLGRAVVPTRGYFQACGYEALTAALDEAQRTEAELTGIGATGFAANQMTRASRIATETACHALGAFTHFGHAMTLVNIGGRDPQVIMVDGCGRRVKAHSVRRCAVGVGSFLMFAARHLDIAPSRLEELAAAAEQPARVSSYCSVFSNTELLERLREGASREAVALGCIHSIAERIVEIGRLVDPVAACGGVVEYFPGVLRALESLSGRSIRTMPEPILTGALGAGLMVFRPAADTESPGVAISGVSP